MLPNHILIQSRMLLYFRGRERSSVETLLKSTPTSCGSCPVASKLDRVHVRSLLNSTETKLVEDKSNFVSSEMLPFRNSLSKLTIIKLNT